ncbi:hypothetical protein EDD11_000626 [Mortierella claussenii]|nr:hypothetical protein EDD11_000626 [Mortierella claussenii]
MTTYAEEYWDRLVPIFDLLRPDTREDAKFMGLLFMSEVTQDTQELKVMKGFFDHMDFLFMDRMLRMEPHEVPPQAGVDATGIRTIAVDIMTCFATHWQLLIRKEFKDRVPAMLKLLSSKDQTGTSKKILNILIKLSAYPQSSMILTNAGYQSTIISFVLDTINRGDRDLEHHLAHDLLVRTFLIIQEGFKQNPGTVQKVTREFLPTVMTKLSRPFGNPNEPHKKELLHIMEQCVIHLPESYTMENANEFPAETSAWMRNIKSGLLQLMSTRQAPAVRDECFKLTGFLLHKLGPRWLFPDVFLPTREDSDLATVKRKSSPASIVTSMEILSLSSTELDKKYAALVVHLTAVEVRAIMDLLGDELIPEGSELKSKGVFTSEDEIKQIRIRKEHVLPCAFHILDVTIGYLVRLDMGVEGSVKDALFNATGLLRLQVALSDAFSSVLDYVKDLQESCGSQPDKLVNNVKYLACIKILYSWLLEEDSLHSQAIVILQPLKAVVRYWYNMMCSPIPTFVPDKHQYY